ncbi:MAG: esterase-like activity of phytase family protein [Candidatus Nitronauta litoralis]|uniref:Esterase-like activity of phytase family protein n=1 Tax=Candidatus Nitronauta litoralis TaxID=2705533 RepID=A0A7T0BZY1_9BACT|nr:MAG: esterase-like activity of phytase family protein [Candidatus Nitronauta litoralis]
MLLGGLLLSTLLFPTSLPASENQDPGSLFKRGEVFQRISNFPVYLNNSDPDKETAAEIIKVTEDGNTLIYTDSPGEVLGFVDITNPRQPQPLGTLPVEGEPTSVSVAGNLALVGVNTSQDFTQPSGFLAVVDVLQRRIIRKIPLAGQPDSVAVGPRKRFLAIAIENERDEDLVVNGVEGGLPQLPAGLLQVIRLRGPVEDWEVKDVLLTGLSDLAPADPEPEFVSINRSGIAAVTLQENNHIVLVSLSRLRVMRDFPAGTVDLKDIDTLEEDVIKLTGSLSDVPREPDAIAWLGNFWVVTANEGDLNGGSRGFSIFTRNGKVLFDSGNQIEHLAVTHGHYPESRSENKGTEPEGVEVGRYGNRYFIFVGSERGNFVSVYHARLGRKPEFLQLLPTGIGPEGLLAIPERKLLVVAAENDEPGGIRSMISLYQLEKGPVDYPTIVSGKDASGLPIPWGALSALAADRNDSNRLFTVHDSFYKESKLYSLDVSQKPAKITSSITLLKNGSKVAYDLEGLVQRTDGSFWAVSEGKIGVADNLLIKISPTGNILEEISLPASVNALAKNHGFEGVAATESDGEERVFVAFQREWEGDPAGLARVGEYSPSTGDWRFFYYPLDAPASPAGGWVGLSEIVAMDEVTFLVIERDNKGGPDATIKKIYEFSIQGLTSQPQGGAFPVVSKILRRDLLPDLESANGWVLDKVEGLVVGSDGNAYAVTDNDGVEDATGETQFLWLETLEQK